MTQSDETWGRRLGRRDGSIRALAASRSRAAGEAAESRLGLRAELAEERRLIDVTRVAVDGSVQRHEQRLDVFDRLHLRHVDGVTLG